MEAYCVRRARGASVVEAYTNAGYNDSASNAQKMERRPHIQARIAWLMAEAAAGRDLPPIPETEEPPPRLPPPRLVKAEIVRRDEPDTTAPPADDSEPELPEAFTAEWVLKRLFLNLTALEKKTRAPSAGNAINKAIDLFGRELGMWQTPFAPKKDKNEVNPLSHMKKEQLLIYMIKEVGFEAAMAAMERCKPRTVAAPNGAGNGEAKH